MNAMSSNLSTVPATCAQTPLARAALARCHRLALLALARPGMQDWPEQRRQAQWHLERLAACLEAAHEHR